MIVAVPTAAVSVPTLSVLTTARAGTELTAVMTTGAPAMANDRMVALRNRNLFFTRGVLLGCISMRPPHWVTCTYFSGGDGTQRARKSGECKKDREIRSVGTLIVARDRENDHVTAPWS